MHEYDPWAVAKAKILPAFSGVEFQIQPKRSRQKNVRHHAAEAGGVTAITPTKQILRPVR